MRRAKIAPDMSVNTGRHLRDHTIEHPPRHRLAPEYGRWRSLGQAPSQHDAAAHAAGGRAGRRLLRAGPAPAAGDGGQSPAGHGRRKGVRIPGARDRETEPDLKPRQGKGEKRGTKNEAVVTAAATFHREPRAAQEMVDTIMRGRTAAERERRRQARSQRHDGSTRATIPHDVQARGTMQGKDKAFADPARHLHRRDPTGLKPVVILLDSDPPLEQGIRSALRQEQVANHRRRDRRSLACHGVRGVCLGGRHSAARRDRTAAQLVSRGEAAGSSARRCRPRHRRFQADADQERCHGPHRWRLCRRRSPT